jgi:lantibiotic modifying enzyme
MSSEFLDAAAAIGRRIAEDAIWDEGRCSWVGICLDPKEAWQAEYRVLDPSIYDGTAGVGLFLAELASATGDGAARRTAVGALRHAVMRAPASRRQGFHAGSLGIAWAAARVAELVGEEELCAAARAVPAAAPPVPDEWADVVLGTAGSLIARLSLAEVFDDQSLVDDAVTGGERLIELAAVTPHGWSWATPSHPRRTHLCGLSHGAGGIGWALLELFAATGDARFREGAEGAFAYERSWLHEPSGTWPDLRVAGHRRGAGRRAPSPTIGSWCHGEGGIALVRVRAVEVLGPDPYEREAAIAFEATRRDLASALPYEIGDMTICHGAAGAADALMCNGDSPEAAALGHVALERYGSSGRWPVGPLGGTTPALFRGLAGIGWWLLRLHDPGIPSPLAAPMRLTPVVTRA